MMKKFYYLFVAVAALLLATACGNKKTQTREDRVEAFRSSLNSEDTTEMLRLCDVAMERLKDKQYGEVIASLYEYDDSTREVKPLSDQLAKRYEKMFKLFPVLSYERQYYSFMHEGANDVKYEVTFATAEQLGSDKPATTMYMFNPVKVDGDWKLCVKSAQNEIDTLNSNPNL